MSARVLHVAKVAGISGSENHLLLLLPALRERGYDVRFAMLHEDEPGAAEFATRLREGGVHVEELRFHAATAPILVGRLVRLMRRHAPQIVHTHLVHADFLGLPAGGIARVPVLATTGRPRSIASSATMPKPSPREGTTTSSARSSTGATGATRPRNVTAPATP